MEYFSKMDGRVRPDCHSTLSYVFQVRNSLATANDIRTIVRQIKAHVQQVSKERCRKAAESSNAGAGVIPSQTGNGHPLHYTV